MTESRKESLLFRCLLFLLLVCGFCSGFIFEIGTVSVNVSQIFAVVICSYLILASLANRLDMPVFFKDDVSFFIYAYFVSNLFSSVLFAENKELALRGTGVVFCYVFIYGVTRWAMKFAMNHRNVILKMMWLNVASAAFGLACLIISLATGGKENIGVTTGHLASAGITTLKSFPASVKSLGLEPNLFAVVTAVLLCINLAIYLLWKKSFRQLIVIGILSIAVLFTYTRSVYVALAVVLVMMIILANRTSVLRSIVVYIFIFALLVLPAVILLPESNTIKQALKNRTSTLVDFKSGSGLGRVMGYRIGLKGWKESPVWGNGTSSAKTRIYYKLKGEFIEPFGSAGWLTGVWIQSLHDTGLIGFAIVAGIFASLLLANYRLFKRLDNSTIDKSIALGFFGGNLILLITAQLSSSLWISFPYIYWGVNMAFVAHAKKRNSEVDVTTIVT